MNKLSYFLLILSLFLSACGSEPFILDLYPADNAVVRNSTVVIKFRVAEPINIRSFNESSLRIYGECTGPLKINARYAQEKQEVRIVVLDSLCDYEYIHVVITDLVHLKNGKQIPRGAEWGFLVLPLLDQATTTGEKPIYVAVEKLPEPIGGIAEIQRKVVYPNEAKRADIQGMVFIEALIDEVGRVYQTTVLRGIGGGCDEAAAEAVRQTRFIPGIHKGQPVKVKMSIPIRFRLSR
ncbi:MAG: energy transducer TonB [Ignavibacteriae bacterium]|nr:energy transducer TonB [Ignavibacteriota bacterium]